MQHPVQSPINNHYLLTDVDLLSCLYSSFTVVCNVISVSYDSFELRSCAAFICNFCSNRATNHADRQMLKCSFYLQFLGPNTCV